MYNSRILVENCVVGICNNGMFLQFYELTFEMKYLAGVYKLQYMLKYMLNYIVRADNCDMICWIVGFSLTFDVHKYFLILFSPKSLYRHHGVSI